MADYGDQDLLTEGRPPSNEDRKYGDPPDEGENLLTIKDPKKAAELNYKNWKSLPKEERERHRAEWKVNNWRFEGRTNVHVQKSQDKGTWTAWEPPWDAPPIPVLNKAARLCRRLKNIMFADPPVPEAIPSTGEEEDIEAARLGKRILEDVQSEANLDDIRTARRAFDRASIYGSGFVRYYTDPKGGGRKAIRIMAKRGAVNAATPFLGEDGKELPGELVARYVTEDGTLQDTPQGAATRWMPALKREILPASSIRFLPHDAEDIWDAEGVVLGIMPTWGELEDLWPEEMKNIKEDDKQALFSFKPENAQDLKGYHSRASRQNNESLEMQKDKRVPCFITYYKACPTYPDGCYFVGLGKSITLYRDGWIYEPEEGDREELDIPITQYTQFDAGRPDPFGQGLMHLLGNLNELRGTMVGHLIQYLDQFAGRRTFVPTNSVIQPKQYQLLAGAVIPINPGGEPSYEEIPALPAAPMEMYALATEEADDHSMMKETAQGGEVPGVNSGRQAAIITQNAMASLSEIRQNVERGYVRGCRIQAQLIRRDYTIPQQISWTGEDGQYRQQWWSGSDLRGTADFKLKQGSLSMMTPEQKMNLAVSFKEMGVYETNPDLFYDAITSTMGPTIGLEDDPSRARIKRQLGAWSMGPPSDWIEGYQTELQQRQEQLQTLQAQLQAAMAQPPVEEGSAGLPPVPPPIPQPAPGIGVEAPAPPPPAPEELQAQLEELAQAPPPDPNGALAAIFELVEADEVQDVAMIRLAELKRFMASTRFTRWPPEWRGGVVQEFQHMKLCAGVQTIPEQMQQQQEQQQGEQEATAQAEEQKHQNAMELEQLRQDGRAQAASGGSEDREIEIGRDPTGRPGRIRVRKVPAAEPAGV